MKKQNIFKLVMGISAISGGSIAVVSCGHTPGGQHNKTIASPTIPKTGAFKPFDQVNLLPALQSYLSNTFFKDQTYTLVGNPTTAWVSNTNNIITEDVSMIVQESNVYYNLTVRVTHNDTKKITTTIPYAQYDFNGTTNDSIFSNDNPSLGIMLTKTIKSLTGIKNITISKDATISIQNIKTHMGVNNDLTSITADVKTSFFNVYGTKTYIQDTITFTPGVGTKGTYAASDMSIEDLKTSFFNNIKTVLSQNITFSMLSNIAMKNFVSNQTEETLTSDISATLIIANDNNGSQNINVTAKANFDFTSQKYSFTNVSIIKSGGMTPSTKIFTGNKFNMLFTNNVKNILPIGKNWSLSDFYEVRTADTSSFVGKNVLLNIANAKLFATLTTNGMQEILLAKAHFNYLTENYSFTNIVISDSSPINLTPTTKIFSNKNQINQVKLCISDFSKSNINEISHISFSSISKIHWNKNIGTEELFGTLVINETPKTFRFDLSYDYNTNKYSYSHIQLV